MVLKKSIEITIKNTVKKVLKKNTKNAISKNVNKIQIHKPPLIKHKYSKFWQFHHGDEI